MTTKLQRLFQQEGQSPWLDNLTWGHLTRGELDRLVADGIRGVTSNPTIFAKAIGGSDDYDEQFRALIDEGAPAVSWASAGASSTETKPSPPSLWS